MNLLPDARICLIHCDEILASAILRRNAVTVQSVYVIGSGLTNQLIHIQRIPVLTIL